MKTTATIREATAPDDIARARALFVEYARWLNVDLCFQGFDQELATLPGAYGPPEGRLLLAGEPGQALGCIALRRLEGTKDRGRGSADSASTGAEGEIKRLYVRPAARNGGWGRSLVLAVVAEARAIGYRELKLDTLDWMIEARTLYAKLGFRECAPYYPNPLAGAVYMALAL